MVFLIVIHAGLIIWASTLAISFLYRVDLSSESVKVRDGGYNDACTTCSTEQTRRHGGRWKKRKKNPLLLSLTFYFLLFSLPSQVNDALEVFGERDIDPSLWMDGSNDGSIRQAHIRIGSRTSA